MSEQEHFVEFSYGSWGVVCNAPDESLCHAEWECDCESWSKGGVDNGVPWHVGRYDEHDQEIKCLGKFGTYCNYQDWFEDDQIEGSIRLPCDIDWDDSPVFHIGTVLTREKLYGQIDSWLFNDVNINHCERKIKYKLADSILKLLGVDAVEGLESEKK